MKTWVGLDIGGTNVRAISSTGRSVRHATPHDLEQGLDLIRSMVRDVSTGTLQGIGAAIGGPLDWKTGVVSPLHQPAWRNVPLKHLMEKEFGVPFVVDVDTNVAAWGEWKERGGKIGRLLYITISTGMGGGLIVDGEIYRGPNGAHPEIGHQTIGGTDRCECGAVGCLEEMVSGNGIRRRYGKPAEKLRDREWEEVGTFLGQGMRNLSAIYAPEVIVLGGGISIAVGERLLAPARRVLAETLKIVPVPKVELSILGLDTPLAGALHLARAT
jgi:predicted NBD/HSP70 family sugar kinase